MRKYIIGTIFGFALSFAVGAHAEVKNMIDKVVEGSFPVTIEGKKLESDAVVIEGSTYLPVRAFGEAIGYTVGFDSDLGVSLTKTVTESTYKPEMPTPTPVKESDGLPDTIEEIDLAIERTKQMISINENLLKHMDPIKFPGDQVNIDFKTNQNKEYQDKIDKLEKKKAELTSK